MKFVTAMMLLGVLAAGCLSGCLTLAWKGTEAGTEALAKQDKPENGPILRYTAQGAEKTNEGMKKADQAVDTALEKAKDAVTK